MSDLFIVGVDEVGRGPLVGNVVAAAVLWCPHVPIPDATDSKKLTAAKREKIADFIRKHALDFGVGHATPGEIDELNILQASLLAMQRAVAALKFQPDWIMVDGNKKPNWNFKTCAVVKGDARVPAIGAASILAKVVRDAEMDVLHLKYPDYLFATHKGYPTAVHLEKLKQLGPLPEHRRSFRPVRECEEV